MTHGLPDAPPTPGKKLPAAWWVLAVLLLAVAPSLGTLGAPPISDDGAALGYVHREGAFVDWPQPQYGLRIVRFWRPLVTTSLDLQEAWTGSAPAPLRLFNLAGHAAAAVLAGLLARRLGAGAAGALAAGALAATFPDQGGTVTWIVGRVDSLTVPLVLGALWLALGASRASRAAAAAAAFLACASKEVALIAPLAGALLSLGMPATRGRWGRALAAAAPLLLGAGAAFLVRRAALGLWVGGYPAPAPDPLGAARVLATAFALPLCAGLLALLVAGARRASWRALACGCLAAAASLLPLLPLLAGGVLEEQNRRWLFLCDALLAAALGGALRTAPGLGGRAACAVLAAAVGVRAWQARADTREWAASAMVAEAHVDRVRAALAALPPSDEPVLDAAAPRTHAGAYCLAWGLADRFRAPFEPAARPVWPRRVMFAQRAAGERERPSATPEVAGLSSPCDAGARLAPLLPVTVAGAPVLGPLAVDSEAAAGRGPVLELWGEEGALELLVYTELGYETVALPAPAAGALELAPGPAGAAMPVRRIALGEVLRQGAPFTLGEALIQAADAGSTRAYMEVRAGDPAQPRAVSPMIPLVWRADLLAQLGVGD